MSTNKKDTLGDRMKEYENVTRMYLKPRTPIIVRLDGRAFHTFTRKFEKPFDEIFITCMEKTLQTLCEEVSGVLFGYTQSDEISLLLGCWKNQNTQSFFNGNVLKIASVTSSIATLAFNKAMVEEINKAKAEGKDVSVYAEAQQMVATFDSRCFNVPFDEVLNVFIWRQNDAIRNSKQALGQAYYSQKQLHKLNCDEIVEMLKKEKGIVWSEYPIYQQRGIFCEKQEISEDICFVNKKTGERSTVAVKRDKWVPNREMPLFVEDRERLEKMIKVG